MFIFTAPAGADRRLLYFEDDWLLWKKLIIQTNDVITEPTWFLLLILISEALITPELACVYRFC